MQSFRTALLTLVPVCLAIGVSGSARASTYTYTGASTGSSGQWHVAANWDPPSIPGNGLTAPPYDDLVFGTGSRKTPLDDLVSYQNMAISNFNSITFTNGGFNPNAQNNSATSVKNIIWLTGGITNLAGMTGNNGLGISIFLQNAITVVNYTTNYNLSFTPYPTANNTPALTNLSFDTVGSDLTFDGPGNIVVGTTANPGYIRGSGNLIKKGSGVLTLNGANTYTGLTRIDGGRLNFRNVHAGGGAITEGDGTTLGVTVTVANNTLPCSTLTLGTASGGSVTNSFDTGAYGNPTQPVVYATNLVTTGAVYVNVTGSGYGIGQFPLIKYQGSIGGDGYTFLSANLPTSVGSYLSNNAANGSVDLVVTNFTSLLWTGQTNGVVVGVWDINGTSNWVVLGAGAPAFFDNGMPVSFDDNGATKVVTLATTVQPFDLDVTTAATYTLTNTVAASRIGGSARITKDGPGTLILGTATNSYDGFTWVKAGTVQLAAHEAIGNGSSVTNDGVLDLNGFSDTFGPLSGSGVVTNSSTTGGTGNTLTIGGLGSGAFSGRIDEGPGTLALVKTGAGVQKLSGNNLYSGGTTIATVGGTLQLGADNVLGSGPVNTTANVILTPDSATPRSLRNDIVLTRTALTLGSPGAGLLTLSGNICFTNYSNSPLSLEVYCNSDVVWSNSVIMSLSTNTGWAAKRGPGNLTLRNVSSTTLTNDVTFAHRDGAVIIDGGALTLDHAYQVRGDIDNGRATLLLTNNGSLVLPVTGNLRIGSDGSLGGSATATNIVEVWDGTVRLFGGGGNGQVLMGYDCARAVLNAHRGSLFEVAGFAYSPGSLGAPAEINFDGAVVKPTRNTMTYIQGIQQVALQSGGLTVDTTNHDIGIPQDLSAGSGAGGLTKKGEGSLTLTGFGTYRGSTRVEEGSLTMGGLYGGGGAVIVADDAALTVDTSFGPLPISALTLNGTNAGTSLTISNWVPSAGMAAIHATNLTVNGSGNVINLAVQFPPSPGRYPLLAYSGTIGGGGFAALTLGPLPAGMVGRLIDTGSSVDLEFTIPFAIGHTYLSDTDFVMSGSGGSPGTSYYLVTSTNVALAMVDWQPVATNLFDGLGNFAVTNPIAPGEPARYFRIRLP